MRSKILLSVLVIALAAALLAGATGAWFTDDATLAGAEFTAGTVIISTGEEADMGDYAFDNVNPGDTTEVCWNIVNDGSKDAMVRVEINSVWEKAGAELNDVALLELLGNDWVFHETEEGAYYYYTGVLDGTFERAGDENDSITLCFDIVFDGEGMDNDYQAATYTINGTVDAIQASNGAAAVEWGFDPTNQAEPTAL